MAELRWNPLLDTWTMVATNRQQRPHLPKNWCAFCPGEGKLVPASFDVFAYPNDFPVLTQTPDDVPQASDPFFKNKEAYGKCEVILYSPDHEAKLYELSEAHIGKLTKLWQERFVELSKDPNIKYVFIFENRGEEVGVTMTHPHGQLYAYSWMPAKLKTELDNCKNYFATHNRNLFDDLNRSEKEYAKRIIYENESFIAYIPYFTDYPFGVFIVAKNELLNLGDFSEKDLQLFGAMLQQITKGFDALYDRPFPYMMCMHQSPVNSDEYSGHKNYYRFHVEFYPPLRAKEQIKWYASSEMGAGAAANPLDVDECAEMLRDKIFQMLIS